MAHGLPECKVGRASTSAASAEPSTQPDENASANVISGNCSLPQKDLADDPEKLGQSAMVQDAPDFQDGLIGAREKHKQSVEYKRAAEWASRQRQLAIQAEEAKDAKRLRKRKKAEALRLLDMEKRQNQRLEEVRESQRKNEEGIQLKEQHRGVVRLELENIERRYTDIPVEGCEVCPIFTDTGQITRTAVSAQAGEKLSSTE